MIEIELKRLLMTFVTYRNLPQKSYLNFNLWMYGKHYIRELYSSAISSFSFICVKIPGAGGNVANLYNLIFIMTALSLPAPHHYYLILSI